MNDHISTIRFHNSRIMIGFMLLVSLSAAFVSLCMLILRAECTVPPSWIHIRQDPERVLVDLCRCFLCSDVPAALEMGPKAGFIQGFAGRYRS